LIKSDIRELDEQFKKAEGLEARDRKACMETLERCLKLYRGELCADVGEECLENARLLYRDRRLKILKKLGRHYLAEQMYLKALEYLEPASDLDDFDENLHTDIMRCHAGLGDRKSLQKRFNLLAAKLKELGIDAVPESAQEIVKSVK
jgi:two-component SAPR family response regulator